MPRAAGRQSRQDTGPAGFRTLAIGTVGLPTLFNEIGHWLYPGVWSRKELSAKSGPDAERGSRVEQLLDQAARGGILPISVTFYDLYAKHSAAGEAGEARSEPASADDDEDKIGSEVGWESPEVETL